MIAEPEEKLQQVNLLSNAVPKFYVFILVSKYATYKIAC